MHSHAHRMEYPHRSEFQKKVDVNGQQGGRYPASTRGDRDLFSCINPTHPEYAGMKARLFSFAKWPNHIKASAESIAEAGFFFLGERDRCKCHYCNGGLQNWEEDDDPWFEHAKWFPQCEYVLQQKGLEYVSGINAMFPNLSRPGDSTPQRPRDIPPFQTYNSNEHISTPPSGASNNDVPQMEITTCTTSSSSQEESSEHSMELELIEQFKMFGFESEIVNGILNIKHCKGERFKSVSEMMDAAQEYEMGRLTGMVTEPMESMDTEVPERRLEADECRSGAAVSQTVDHCELETKLQSAVVTSNCVVCGKEERSCVFTSCGHFCCCNDCGQDLRECPLCNVKIASAMRIYRI